MSEVIFPIVGSGRTDLVCVSCACLSPDDFPAGKVLVLGQNDQDIEHILADARHDEPGGPEITIPIRVRFKPNHFSGKSYGLALALADKRARYRRDDDQGDVRLWATGVVLPGGSGEIGSVSGIDDKLDAIGEEAKAGDVIILPSADVDLSDPAIRAKLERMASRRVTCHAISHLNEIAYLWSESAPAPEAIMLEKVDRTDPTPPEVQQSPSVDDTGDPVRGSKLPKLVIAALSLLIVLAVSMGPEPACDTAELQRNENEARGLFFKTPRDVPIEIRDGQGSDPDAADMLSLVRGSMTDVVEEKFKIVPESACAGVRLDIWVERDQQIRTINAAMLWSSSGKPALQQSWMVEVDDHAEKVTIEERSAKMAHTIMRSIFSNQHPE